MKRSIIAAVLLAAMACGFMWLSMEKREEYQVKLAAYEEAYEKIQQQETALKEKQAALDALTTDQADQKNAEAEALIREAETLEQEILALQTEIATLQGSLDNLSGEYQAKKDEMDYLDQVYQALQEGYEKVKGYIAGN